MTILLILFWIYVPSAVYALYQLMRADKIDKIRGDWKEANDPRYSVYSWDDMQYPCKQNWLGFRWPKDKHYKQ